MGANVRAAAWARTDGNRPPGAKRPSAIADSTSATRSAALEIFLAVTFDMMILYQIMSTNVPEHDVEPSSEGSVDDDVRVRRVPYRASYDVKTVHAILDAGWVAHVGTVRDGSPVVIPMYYVRDGDSVLLHGAPAAGVMRRGRESEICMTVTLLDGFVLARSAFHHSMNFRSVVIVGTAHAVNDPSDKARALELFVDAMVPGRHNDLRPTTKKEMTGTRVVRLSLDRSSAKVRLGGPVDDDEDYGLRVWAGVLPLITTVGAAIDDERNLAGVSTPRNVAEFVGFSSPG